jgi:hypothetical protein
MSDTHLARSNSMSINRRKFLGFASSTVTASGLLTATAAATDAKAGHQSDRLRWLSDF